MSRRAVSVVRVPKTGRRIQQLLSNLPNARERGHPQRDGSRRAHRSDRCQASSERSHPLVERILARSCREGNMAMVGILSGARAPRRRSAQATGQGTAEYRTWSLLGRLSKNARSEAHLNTHFRKPSGENRQRATERAAEGGVLAQDRAGKRGLHPSLCQDVERRVKLPGNLIGSGSNRG